MTKEFLIRSMGHLALQTPDLKAAVFEAENICGLSVVSRSNERVVVSSNKRRGEISYMRGDKPAALAVGLEALGRSEIDQIVKRLKSNGLEIISDLPLAPGAEYGVRFSTQWGHVFEIHTPVPRDQKMGYSTAGVRPHRLDHASLNTPDTEGLRDLIVDVLGMRLSDRTDGNEFMWFRAADGMHHSLGVVRAAVPSLHHYSFEALQFSDYARLGDTLRLHGRTYVWGPGHHGANVQGYFSYHLDTLGALIEYSQGMNRVEDELRYGVGDVWEITLPAAGDWIDMWGSTPPQAFLNAGIPFENKRT